MAVLVLSPILCAKASWRGLLGHTGSTGKRPMLSTGVPDGQLWDMLALANDPTGLMIVPGEMVRVHGCIGCR